MAIDKIKVGTAVSVSTEFYDDNGNPFAVSVPVTYEIRDFNRNLIVSGVAIQDSNNLAKWSANITIPSNAPIGEYHQRYTLKWSAKNNKGMTIQNAEHFSLVPPSNLSYTELDLLLPERSALSDSISVDDSQVVSEFQLRVITPDGSEVYVGGVVNNPTPISVNGNKIYNFTSPPIENLRAGASAFALYIIQWNFLLDGVPTQEHHFVYVVNPKVLAYVNELKRMIDKANISHLNPNLRYNNVDLVAFLNLGIQWVNSQPPTITGFTLADIPDSLYWYVLNAAAYNALSSRFLAEGEAAFDFSGQPITLNVDRTGFLESAMGRYQQAMENIQQVKRTIILSGARIGSGGVLLLSTGPTVDYMGDRTLRYEGILAQLYSARPATYST